MPRKDWNCSTTNEEMVATSVVIDGKQETGNITETMWLATDGQRQKFAHGD